METSEKFKVVPLMSIDEIHNALTLAEDVFMEFEAPCFPKKGVDSFLDFLWGKHVREMIDSGNMLVWGCYFENELVGMMALRSGDHISLAFVKGEFHRRGRRLRRTGIGENKNEKSFRNIRKTVKI